jgi:hypothetical protein
MEDLRKVQDGCVRDKLWIWEHEAGSHNEGWGIPRPSRMTPVEGAFYLGIPNIIMIRYNGKPPIASDDQYIIPFRALKGIVEKISPGSGKLLGCYMWDYGTHKPMPVDLMEMQCNIGLRWLREGRIEGMIFLASCICDLDLDAVEWTRSWIAGVGNEKVSLDA